MNRFSDTVREKNRREWCGVEGGMGLVSWFDGCENIREREEWA